MRNIFLAICIAAALSIPAFTDDHGQGGGGDDHGRGGQTATPGQNQSGDNHGNNGTTSSNNGATSNQSGQSNGDGDNHGDGDDNDNNQVVNQGQVGNVQAVGNQDMQRTRLDLSQTPTGVTEGVTGKIDVRAQGDRQRLKVEIDATANLVDGTVFTVFASTDGTMGTPIGTITLHLQEGEFEADLRNGAALANGMLPSMITSISVTDAAGNVVLQATFGPLISSATPPAPAAQPGVSRTQAAFTGMANANGNAELRVQGVQERLRIEVEANVPEGTTMMVVADGVLLGTLTFHLQVAEFEIDTPNTPLPMGLTALDAIHKVELRNTATGEVLMTATLKM